MRIKLFALMALTTFCSISIAQSKYDVAQDEKVIFITNKIDKIDTLNFKIIKLENTNDNLSKRLDDTNLRIIMVKDSISLMGDKLNAKLDSINQTIVLLGKAKRNLSKQLNMAKLKYDLLEGNLSATGDSLIVLKKNLATTEIKLNSIENNLELKIRKTGDKASSDLSALSDTVSKSTLYWIFAVFFIAILSLLLFGWLKKQLSKDKTGLSDQIQKTSKLMREEQIKLDGQLIKLIDSQMQLMKDKVQSSSAKTEEIDHTLALKVADEIVRIEKNINRLEGNEKKIKPIIKGLERIRDNFAVNGYEMVQLINTEYDDRMNIDVINFINDDNIPAGKQIITRVIRPQVNYKGVLKQKAQVDVSLN